MTRNGGAGHGSEQPIRRLALQLSVQLPADHGEALRIIEELRDIIIWRDGGRSGREERSGKLQLVRGMDRAG